MSSDICPHNLLKNLGCGYCGFEDVYKMVIHYDFDLPNQEPIYEYDANRTNKKCTKCLERYGMNMIPHRCYPCFDEECKNGTFNIDDKDK